MANNVVMPMDLEDFMYRVDYDYDLATEVFNDFEKEYSGLNELKSAIDADDWVKASELLQALRISAANLAVRFGEDLASRIDELIQQPDKSSQSKSSNQDLANLVTLLEGELERAILFFKNNVENYRKTG